MDVATAAVTLGVSTDTVLRRLRRGNLPGHKEGAPPRVRWVVDIAPGNGHSQAQANGLVELVELLRSQVEEKDRQLERMHVLLQQQGAALAAAAPRRPWWKVWG